MDNLAAYSIPALVQAAANGFGDMTCAIAPERTVTFREFAADVATIAGHLEGLGIAAGDRVAILDVNSLDFLETLCALGVLGAVAVPLNYRQRVPEHRFQIEDSGARLLLANPQYATEAGELASSLALGWRPINDTAQPGPSTGALDNLIRRTDLDPATPLAICSPPRADPGGDRRGAVQVALLFKPSPVMRP